MITGKELVEKMYSENYDEYEDTRLYSTGDDYLDELLERAFCEGYEYAQREFAQPQIPKLETPKIKPVSASAQPLKPGMSVKSGLQQLEPKKVPASMSIQSQKSVFNPKGLNNIKKSYSSRNNNRPRGPITTQLAQTSSNNRPRGPITTGQTKGSASTTPTTTTLPGVTGVNYTYK